MEYIVLRCDYPDFDPNHPNTSGGCQQIRLDFEEGTIELNWDNIDGLRDKESCYFHITTLANTGRQNYQPASGADWEANEENSGLVQQTIRRSGGTLPVKLLLE